MLLAPRPLTAATYAPFGAVVAAGDGPGRLGNQGRARIWDRVAPLPHDRPGATPNLGLFRTVAWPSSRVEVRWLERHPHSTQLFVPMTAARYLVVVAPPGPLDPTRVHAFLARPDQAVTYLPGVWHHPLLALDRDADFTCLVWEDGTAADCELVELDPDRRPTVEVPPP